MRAVVAAVQAAVLVALDAVRIPPAATGSRA